MTRMTSSSLIIVTLVFALGLAGCKEKDSPPPPRKVTTPTENVKMPTTELLPEGSGAFSKRTIYGGTGGMTPVEVEIKYANGDMGRIFLRPDGTVRETSESYPDGTRKSKAVYSNDGKSVVRGELYRRNGTLMTVATALPEGAFKVDSYTLDGKTLFKSEQPDSAGLINRVVYRQDGSVWARVKVDTNITYSQSRGIVESNYYDSHGKLTKTVLYSDDGMVVSCYGEDGALYAKQTWSWSYDGLKAYRLEAVEEIGQDGKVSRTLTIEERQGQVTVTSLVEHTADGGKIVFAATTDAAAAPLLVDIYDLQGRRQDRHFTPTSIERKTVYNPNGEVVSEQSIPGATLGSVSANPALFVLPRDMQLDALAHAITGSDRSIDMGSPMSGPDPVRSWYQSLIGR